MLVLSVLLSTADAVAQTNALILNDTTWTGLLAKLRAGLNNQNGRAIALFVCYSTTATSILTGGRVTSYMKGYVTMSGANSNLYDFFGGALSNGDMYAWRITASDSEPTISNFRRFVDYEQSTANKAKSAYTNWGTSLTANDFRHGLLLADYSAAYIVWFSSTTNIQVRSLRTGSVNKTSDNGSITFGDDSADDSKYTITRSGSTITVTTTNNSTMSLIYN